MEFPMDFIKASNRYTKLGEDVPAPLFRRTFEIKGTVEKASLLICGLGFYTLHINGKDITKGHLAPYISNPDDILYYDHYDISSFLKHGVNIIGVILGNGFFNNPGGRIWDFDKAPWRGPVRFALKANITLNNNEKISFESDSSFLTAPSPIIADDYRWGEIYDARKEIKGWDSDPSLDVSNWTPALPAKAPRGEKRICKADPIITSEVLRPEKITKTDKGYIYDFGVNIAGICKLKIKGKAGQTIILNHGEVLKDGDLDRTNIGFAQNSFKENDNIQKDIYICSGNGEEEYLPKFTYHGFRYVEILGLTPEQATKDLLQCLVIHSQLDERGDFSCSDPVLNKLQSITRRSVLSNFHYFPTDCPHREKNGWTGDAAVSIVHMLLNLSVENSLREWLLNIRKAQAENGSLPGIIPTSGWGFAWGNGPVWDAVLTWVPWEIYRFRGDKSILEENANAIFRYLAYIEGKRNEKGLVEIGLGDWCPPGKPAADYDAPLVLTDSVTVMDIAKKASMIFEILKMPLQQSFAEKLEKEMLTAIRENLINWETFTVAGDCQTSQSICIYYDVFTEEEKQRAILVLIDQIKKANNHITTGIVGGRVIFHVLSTGGYIDLAYNMITTPTFPSYGNWLARGATSLWEDFQPEGGNIASLNHHFWGDISHWFISAIAGININTSGLNVNYVDFTPGFPEKLNDAKAWHEIPAGKVTASWEREETENILLFFGAPEVCKGQIILPKGWEFEDGSNKKEHFGGTMNFKIKRK